MLGVFRRGALRAFRSHGSSAPKVSDRIVNVTFINKDGTRTNVKGLQGQNILDVAQANGIEMEGNALPIRNGACEASLACSTCHVIVSNDYFDKLPEACDEEEDMLDLAFGLTEHSRLGCQIILSEELDGITVALPKATRNMAVDGYVAPHH